VGKDLADSPGRAGTTGPRRHLAIADDLTRAQRGNQLRHTSGESSSTARCGRATFSQCRQSDVLAHAARDIDRCAGEVAGAVPGQEGNETTDLIDGAEPAQRDLVLGELGEELLGA
jgi:hypothetical protein